MILPTRAFLAVLLLAGCGPRDPEPARLPDAPAHAHIRVTAPNPGGVIGSPLTVAGEARGTWYFEASFPIRLVDGTGRVLVVVPAQARGEWMTTDFVPFEVQLTFVPPASPEGFLILQKDNPSGLPEHADSLVIPVRFR
jgi:hypothetical protein